MDEVVRLIERADRVMKTASARRNPQAARDRAQEVLQQARDALWAAGEEPLRRDLAVQIARRMADLDRQTLLAQPPSGEVAAAPTRVDDPARVPANQHLTPGWPVLHVGTVPAFDPTAWRFTITGLVVGRTVLSWEEFRALPAVTLAADMHCVTGWSRLDNTWTGVRFRDLVARAGVRPHATHAVVSGHPVYSANLPLDALLDDDVLFAWAHDDRPLPAEHGGPLRLVVPKRYAWKSVKWAFEVRLLPRDVPGYWEERGYHNDADPWLEQRFRGD